jgi:hypothetical protein
VSLWVLLYENILFSAITFSEVLNFNTLTPLLLLISCKFSFPHIDLKLFYTPTLTLNSPKGIFMCT